MIVVNERSEIIGRLNKHFGNPREGDTIAIETVRGGFTNPWDLPISTASYGSSGSGGMATPRRISMQRITAPVVMLRRSVAIDEMELMNRRGQMTKDDVIVLAAHDRLFRELLEVEEHQTVIHKDPVRMMVNVEIKVTAIQASIDIAEQLFDLDEFTPA